MTRQLENNGFNIIEQSSGNWLIECQECGNTGTFSSYENALGNTARRCCESRFLDFINGPIPFSGEPVAVEDEGNGLAIGVDY